MPSLRAVRSFVAAAKHGSFTRAAEALCVTQAAISRQIRELEDHLGTELFVRTGRAVRLSASGQAFFEAAQLSFINIAQAAERIRLKPPVRRAVTVCCTPAVSFLWLNRRLPDFFARHPDIDLRVIATQDFLNLEATLQPDIVIAKSPWVREGYRSTRLFHDWVYPVCAPGYAEAHPEVNSLEGLLRGRLLDLHPHGRAQITEHMDWRVWCDVHGIAWSEGDTGRPGLFRSNDYSTLVQQALTGQGVLLGWHHLVSHLVEAGLLVRPVPQEIVHTERSYHLHHRIEPTSAQDGDTACAEVRDWLLAQV